MPAPGSDSLTGLQWDMDQIHTPEAHAITGGSPSVARRRHRHRSRLHPPDLAPTSTSPTARTASAARRCRARCAANDDNGHGTHTAGTIAAAANGIGIVGVAPNVKIAGIKAGNADGFFFPEAVDLRVHVGRRRTTSTSRTTATSPTRGCSTAGTTPSSGRSGRPSGARSVRAAAGAPSSRPQGNQADDLRTRRRTPRARTTRSRCSATITNDCAVVPVEVPASSASRATGNRRAEVVLLELRRRRRRRRRARRRLGPAADAGGAERAGAVDVARVAAHGHLPAGAARRRRLRRDLLLPAGHVDGLAARRRRGGADRQRHRQAPARARSRA